MLQYCVLGMSIIVFPIIYYNSDCYLKRNWYLYYFQPFWFWEPHCHTIFRYLKLLFFYLFCQNFILFSVYRYYQGEHKYFCHRFQPPSSCLLSQFCNHTWNPECGQETLQKDKRMFLDLCDMHEYNCGKNKGSDIIEKFNLIIFLGTN